MKQIIQVIISIGLLGAYIALPFTVWRAIYETSRMSIQNMIFNIFCIIYLAILTRGIVEVD